MVGSNSIEEIDFPAFLMADLPVESTAMMGWVRALAFRMRNHVRKHNHRPSAFGRAHSLHRRQSKDDCTLHQKAGGVGKVQRVGRLVKKEPPRSYPTWTATASFTLHEGNFSSDGVILVTMRCHSADSSLMFEVIEEPTVGQVVGAEGDRAGEVGIAA